MKKLPLLAAAAVGYVLGTRAGRERYEQIKSGARKVSQNPKVQEAAHKAQDVATQQATAAAELAKEKVAPVASSVADKVRGNGEGDSQIGMQATP
jgi:FKBP-type peptidyl-prolyl cis-trans isomerase